uniref:Uncharacterized protein n=1 Tax=Calcidiscus leptoporus TaxID=127549 RepID=A0A7S0IKD1_9EUKA
MLLSCSLQHHVERCSFTSQGGTARREAASRAFHIPPLSLSPALKAGGRLCIRRPGLTWAMSWDCTETCCAKTADVQQLQRTQSLIISRLEHENAKLRAELQHRREQLQSAASRISGLRARLHELTHEQSMAEMAAKPWRSSSSDHRATIVPIPMPMRGGLLLSKTTQMHERDAEERGVGEVEPLSAAQTSSLPGCATGKEVAQSVDVHSRLREFEARFGSKRACAGTDLPRACFGRQAADETI